MNRKTRWAVWVVVGGMSLAGCGRPTADREGGPGAANETIAVRSSFVLAAEPAGAVDVATLRKSAESGADVVVVGRIGGSSRPWIEGRAAFSMVDCALRPCNQIPGDTCATPWDYCCETDRLPSTTLLVKFVDEAGRTVEGDARDLLGVKELATVVIVGKAQRDDAGNVSVLAEKLYVRP